MDVEEIIATKERLSTLHRHNKKNALNATQESARSYPLQSQGCKNDTSLRRYLSGAKGLGLHCFHRCAKKIASPGLLSLC